MDKKREIKETLIGWFWIGLAAFLTIDVLPIVINTLRGWM